MKVSKLFHWLYAILMLLPAFFVGGRMAYTIFNKNAKDSYSDKTITAQLLVANNGTIAESLEYYITYNNDSTSNTNQVIKYTDISIDWVDYGGNPNYSYTAFGIITDSNRSALRLYTDNYNSTATLLYNVWGVTLNNFYFTAMSNVNLNGNTNYKIFRQELTTMTLDNAFDYSMSQLNDLPLFSWAKDSFLVTPFSYIGNLFGLPAESPIITLLSYWLSISIIYLVFDLIMYVPLLAHRWLDKGMIE